MHCLPKALLEGRLDARPGREQPGVPLPSSVDAGDAQEVLLVETGQGELHVTIGEDVLGSRERGCDRVRHTVGSAGVVRAPVRQAEHRLAGGAA